jgi:hypothetical protein
MTASAVAGAEGLKETCKQKKKNVYTLCIRMFRKD